MSSAPTLDPGTAGVIRQALAAAQSGSLAQACSVAEEGLRQGADAAALHAMLGMLRCRMRDLDAGVVHLRAALELRPDDPKIATNLAAALIEQGKFDEAMEIATSARADADPSLALARFRAFAAQSADRHPEAVEAYEQIIAKAPADWEALNNLGNSRAAMGNFDGAVAALQRAVDLNPGAPPARLNLATAIGRAGRLEVAEQQLRAIAEEFPTDSQALRELHALLKEQLRWEEALTAIEAAVRRAPSDVELILALASHRLLLLRSAGAEAAYRQVVAIDPANSVANVGLAIGYELTNQAGKLSELIGDAQQRGVSDDALNFIRALDHSRAKRFAEGLAAMEQVPDSFETARRHHLLGKLHEGLGNYDEAFRSFARMKELQVDDPSRPEERGTAYRNSIRSSLDMLTPEWASNWRDAGDMDERQSPVFLVGFPRSGTTLLDTMLMGHSTIEVLEEEPAIVHANAHLPDLGTLPTASDEQIKAGRDAYFQTAASLVPLAPGKLLIDKNPLAMNQLPAVLRLFPDARVILAMRHPCDVIFSCFSTNFRLNAGMSNFLRLDTAAELYDLSFRYLERVQQLFPLPMHVVRYENIVADREAELRKLFDFIGLEWSDAVLDHQATAQERGRIKTASYAQVIEPIYTRSAGRWQNYRKHLESVLPVLEPWVRKFGYSL